MLYWKIVFGFSFICFAEARARGGINPNLPCLDRPPMKDFQIDNFIGEWYENARTFESKTQNRSCVRYNYYPVEENDVLPVVQFWVDTSDNSPYVLLKDAKLNENGEGITFDGDKFTVIDVNYDVWAVLLGCNEAENRRTVWLLTRDKYLYGPNMYTLGQIFMENGLGPSDTKPVKQDDCPESWDDAEVIDEGFSHAEEEK